MSVDTRIGRGPLLLDFGAGIIRHEAFADYDGIEFADDVSDRPRIGHLRSTGIAVVKIFALPPFFICRMVNLIASVHLLDTTARAHASKKRGRTTVGQSPGICLCICLTDCDKLLYIERPLMPF